MDKNEEQRNSARIDSDSVFYNRVVPALLIGMGVIMVVLILFALGVLLGIVPFR